MGQQPRALDPDTSPAASLGAQLRSWRTFRGLSQARLGRLVFVSGDLIAKIEKAERRPAPQLVTHLDEVLDSSGALSRCASAVGRPAHDGTKPQSPTAARALRRLEDAVLDYGGGLRGKLEAAVPPLHSLRGDLARAWDAYQASRLDEAAAAAPDLIGGARRAATAGARHRREAERLLASAYHASAATATRLGATDLAWVCADRGFAVAEASGDPAAIAALTRSVAHVLHSTRRCQAAAALVSAAVTRLESRLRRDPMGWSLLGSLHLVAATAAARAGHPDDAHAFLSAAGHAAQELGGDYNHAWTAFGPTNVALHRQAVAVELGDLTAALALSSHVDTSSLPVERRTRHLLQTANLLSLSGKDDQAIEVLLRAERQAPQQVRHHPIARQLVSAWLDRPVAARPDIAPLARRLSSA